MESRKACLIGKPTPEANVALRGFFLCRANGLSRIMNVPILSNRGKSIVWLDGISYLKTVFFNLSYLHQRIEENPRFLFGHNRESIMFVGVFEFFFSFIALGYKCCVACQPVVDASIGIIDNGIHFR